jgi:DNA invertase Pin-like site-specific DNA recombinase
MRFETQIEIHSSCRAGDRSRRGITRLDRLARSTRDLLNTLAAIAGKGAGFRSIADAWADTTTPHGLLDRLTSELRPWLIRGDANFGNEPVLREAEQRSQPYLFKLRLPLNGTKDSPARPRRNSELGLPCIL